MRGLTIVFILVLAQFTIVPFFGMLGHNKTPVFQVVGETVIYKSN